MIRTPFVAALVTFVLFLAGATVWGSVVGTRESVTKAVLGGAVAACVVWLFRRSAVKR
jgi:hypothetical protein